MSATPWRAKTVIVTSSTSESLGLATTFPADCLCGLSQVNAIAASERFHALHHLRWAHGVPLPKGMQPGWPDGLVKVFPTAPMRAQRLAQELARLMQREEHYDFPEASPQMF